MLKPLLNLIEWMNQLEKEFLYESYSHIKFYVMAYQFDEEKYTITHLKLVFTSKSKEKSKWYRSLDEKAVLIEYMVKIDDLLRFFKFEMGIISHLRLEK